MIYNFYQPNIIISDIRINSCLTNLPKGTYYIQFDYFHAPNEILFWIPYEGNIEIQFLGFSDRIRINPILNCVNINNLQNDSGIIIQKNIYKINEKLGDFYRRKAKLIDFIENELHCNVNSDEEDRGFTVSYEENNNITFSFIINKQNANDIRILSQNLDFPEFIFQGSHESKRRIIGNGKIYSNNNIIYEGNINYNLFPQFIDESNNNRLIINIESKRFNLSQEIGNVELVNVNVRREGPFEGQTKVDKHNHYLTKCITKRTYGWICDLCKNSFKKNINSLYCSLCDFDLCSLECRNINNEPNDRRPHFYPNFQIKTLQHKHHLTEMRILNGRNNIKCFSCLKNISENDFLFYCTKCDFRLCNKCKLIEKRGEIFQFHCVWHEHPLTFCKTKGKKRCPICMGFNHYDCIKKLEMKFYEKNEVDFMNDSDYYFICNHCGIEYSRNKDSFYCTACDFYICMKCYKNHIFYIGRDTQNVVNNSLGNYRMKPILCKCYLENENNQNLQCKYCSINLNSHNMNYYCSNCNSNFCENCKDNHLIIFENNIIIYDGKVRNNLRNGYGISYKNDNSIEYDGEWVNNNFSLIKKLPHIHLEQKFIFFIHSQNYDLNWNNLNNNIICDICNKECTSYDKGYSCRECDIDICEECVIKINKTKIMTEHKHNLKIVKSSLIKKCNKCKYQFNQNIVFFSCHSCNYNCCQFCFKKKNERYFNSTTL